MDRRLPPMGVREVSGMKAFTFAAQTTNHCMTSVFYALMHVFQGLNGG
jgi:hypothetical protein